MAIRGWILYALAMYHWLFGYQLVFSDRQMFELH